MLLGGSISLPPDADGGRWRPLWTLRCHHGEPVEYRYGQSARYGSNWQSGMSPARAERSEGDCEILPAEVTPSPLPLANNPLTRSLDGPRLIGESLSSPSHRPKPSSGTAHQGFSLLSRLPQRVQNALREMLAPQSSLSSFQPDPCWLAVSEGLEQVANSMIMWRSHHIAFTECARSSVG